MKTVGIGSLNPAKPENLDALVGKITPTQAARDWATLARIRKIVAAELDVSGDEVWADTTFASLCSDSLEMANLIIELEEAFGIEIDDPYQFPTVQHVITFVEGKA